MSNFRRLLACSAAVILALTTACSDATGPSAAGRSGYLTASSAVQTTTSGTKSTSTTGTSSTSTTSTTSTTSGPKPVKGSVETQNSGYNVTAY